MTPASAYRGAEVALCMELRLLLAILKRLGTRICSAIVDIGLDDR